MGKRVENGRFIDVVFVGQSDDRQPRQAEVDSTPLPVAKSGATQVRRSLRGESHFVASNGPR